MTTEEVDRIIRELALSQKMTEESHRETERLLSESINGLTQTVNHWVGRFGNYIGSIVELILVPGINEQMNKHGHMFNTLSPRKMYYDHKDGSVYAEVDLFLENGEEVMAVEVKTSYEVKDINLHLKRLQKLRAHENENGLKGKVILSAIAALKFHPNARKKAFDLGMYVIEMVESDKSVTVIRPAGKLGHW